MFLAMVILDGWDSEQLLTGSGDRHSRCPRLACSNLFSFILQEVMVGMIRLCVVTMLELVLAFLTIICIACMRVVSGNVCCPRDSPQKSLKLSTVSGGNRCLTFLVVSVKDVFPSGKHLNNVV
jgi:hypothetical protein